MYGLSRSTSTKYYSSYDLPKFLNQLNVRSNIGNGRWNAADPCCGTYTSSSAHQGFVPTPLECQKAPGNPCAKSQNPERIECFLDTKVNRHFTDLVLNYLNTSCNCRRMGSGYTWDEDAQLCVGKYSDSELTAVRGLSTTSYATYLNSA